MKVKIYIYDQKTEKVPKNAQHSQACLQAEKQTSFKDLNLSLAPLTTLQLLYKQNKIGTKSGNLFLSVKLLSLCFHSFFINGFALPESD